MNSPTENDVAHACDALAKHAGFTVEHYDQRRPSGIFAGLPDRRIVHPARGLRVWLELKAPGKKLGHDQHTWLLRELAADGYAAVIDDVQQLHKLLDLLAQPRVGRHQAVHAYCADLVRLCALRGYRDRAA